MKKFNGTITFRVKDNHPDIDCIKDIKEIFTYTDVYSFDNTYNSNDIDDIYSYIKNDLILVACGGYVCDSSYIDILSIKIE